MNTESSVDRTRFGVFAKYWQVGAVKTRLARAIGADAASQLYRLFVQLLLNRFAQVAAERVLCYWPPERESEFAALGGATWQLIPQAAGNLGQKMRHYFADARQAGFATTVLVGSDSPTLPAEYVEQAFVLLNSHPVVLGPSHDGGYYLLGISGELPPIFDHIAWSTSGVWEQTVDRLRTAGISFAQLPAWYDVDEKPDLDRLHRDLQQAGYQGDHWSRLLRAVEAVLEI